MNSVDIDAISYDLSIQLAIKTCDGTPADAVRKYFDLFPNVRKQVIAKMGAFNAEHTEMHVPGFENTNHHYNEFAQDTLEYDPCLREAVEISLASGMASVSMLERRMRLGYARIGRIVDQMEQLGIISEADGAKPRKILMERDQILELLDQLEYRKSAIESFSELGGE